jgi:hypothetical protein
VGEGNPNAYDNSHTIANAHSQPYIPPDAHPPTTNNIHAHPYLCYTDTKRSGDKPINVFYFTTV